MVYVRPIPYLTLPRSPSCLKMTRLGVGASSVGAEAVLAHCETFSRIRSTCFRRGYVVGSVSALQLRPFFGVLLAFHCRDCCAISLCQRLGPPSCPRPGPWLLSGVWRRPYTGVSDRPVFACLQPVRRREFSWEYGIRPCEQRGQAT